MLDSPSDLARRFKREVREKLHGTRYWAGWRMELTFGPYERAFAFDPARVAASKREAARIIEAETGKPPATGPKAEAAALESQRDLWHLSVSWRGGHPVESAKLLLAELVVAMGVPAGKRDGYEAMRTMVRGTVVPQVTHWTWRDS